MKVKIWMLCFMDATKLQMKYAEAGRKLFRIFDDNIYSIKMKNGNARAVRRAS